MEVFTHNSDNTQTSILSFLTFIADSSSYCNKMYLMEKRHYTCTLVHNW